jgi:hypothetical protein
MAYPKVRMGASIDCEIRKPLIRSIWDVGCRDAEGNEKWSESRENVVTNEGLAALMDAFFLGGTAPDGWYVGLTIDGASPLETDTYGTNGFTECATYTGSRKTFTGVAGTSGLTVDNIASKAVFTMGTAGTAGTIDLLGGILVGGSGTTGVIDPGDKGTNGVLYCGIDFSSTKPVVPGDIVSIAITLTAAEG